MVARPLVSARVLLSPIYVLVCSCSNFSFVAKHPSSKLGFFHNSSIFFVLCVLLFRQPAILLAFFVVVSRWSLVHWCLLVCSFRRSVYLSARVIISHSSLRIPHQGVVDPSPFTPLFQSAEATEASSSSFIVQITQRVKALLLLLISNFTFSLSLSQRFRLKVSKVVFSV
ncbi:hypothetical protein RIF29_15526 [Crotalaria pallida]|uniref:Uncharacterized protein n=1 Tax=Crotalaria pallida TaxID=3830 RepID=A0AAN9FKA1_CROPI